MNKKIWFGFALACALNTFSLAAASKTEVSTIKESQQKHGCNCTVLPPYMLDKIEEYGAKNKHPELLRLVKKTRKYALENSRKQLKDYESQHEQSSSQVEGGTKASKASKAARTGRDPNVMVYDAKGRARFGSLSEYNRYTLSSQQPKKGTSVWEGEALSAIFATLNFYWQQFNWNSIDGKGLDLIAVVNYDKSYFNAYYDGYREVFGNPSNDSRLSKWFGSFTSDVDVAAHELTHGVTHYKGDLNYIGQSGAINEHMSDVFGIQIKHYFFQTKGISLTKETKWKIGDHVLKPIGNKEYALRDMLNPGQGYINHPMLGSDPQPADFSKYVPLSASDDNGGVHLYSGPLNRVFALVAEAFGGNSWEKAGVIWYQTYSKLKPDATFVQFARANIDTARELFGDQAANIVEAAWNASFVWQTGV